MNSKHFSSIRGRIIVIAFIIYIAFLTILGRAFQLQVMNNPKLSALANRQYSKRLDLLPKRGHILDRNGSPLAESLDVDSIYAHPHQIRNKSQAARILGKKLQLPPNVILKKLESKKSFVWVKRLVDKTITKELKDINLDGIYFVTESKRFYPNNKLASHVLGFVGIDSDGLSGIELKYNTELLGERNTFQFIQDAKGRPIYLKTAFFDRRREGSSLMLTIDKNIQFIVEKHLFDAVKLFAAESGTAIVINPHNGEILALSNLPDFNPNEFTTSTIVSRRNIAVTDAIEPGSTFKPFVVASALEKNFTPGTKINCENGKFSIGKETIHEAHNHKFSSLTVSDILKYSSNIGMAKIALTLNKEHLYSNLKNLGFGEKTKIDLPGEAKAFFPSIDDLTPFVRASLSFGQGISVTPIQLISAYATLANGGYRIQPHLVKQISTSQEKRDIDFTPTQTIFSQSTISSLNRMLKSVTDEGGTGLAANVDGFNSAGKTGTAQVADLTRGGYLKDAYTSSFVGFLPAERPELVILVVINRPTTAYYANIVAAPVFSKIAQDAVRILDIHPHTMTTKTQTILPKPASFIKTKETLSAALLQDQIDNSIMPDLTGLSLREVLKLFSYKNFPVDINGNGFVVEQFPKDGQKLSANSKITLTFKP